jgi:ATP-dependent DNA helicase RecQ
VRRGLLRQTTDKFSVLELTNAGGAALKERQKITLTKPAIVPETNIHHVGEISCDEVLFDRLRRLRKQLADERNVPAYIVFSDVALRQMARNYPQTETDFARISGVGEKKLREFGEIFLGEIAAYLQTNARQIFADDSFTAPAALSPSRSSLGDSARETLRRFRAGQSVAQIARERDVTTGTIYGHLAEAVERGEPVDLQNFFTVAELAEVAAAFGRSGFVSLGPVFELLGGKIDYGRLRIFRAAANARK